MDKDREDFEKYAVSNGMDITRADNLNKNYSFPMVQFIWAGFQAARALDAERIKELENKVKFYERWLEKGVYFTPAEYAKELEKLASAEASIKRKDDALRECPSVAYDEIIGRRAGRGVGSTVWLEVGKCARQAKYALTYHIEQALSTTPSEAIDKAMKQDDTKE